MARRRRRVHTCHIAGARVAGSNSGRVLDAPSPRPADRPGSLWNMVPVPFIILYLKKLATFLSQRSAWATRIMDLLFERARRKAAPVEEFQWLGLMLFVAVPFPGTGAWTGAIIASVLGMPFWSGLSANFVGVVLAGLLVNLLMNLGLKYAIGTGVLLFIVSTVMWGALRGVKKSLNTK
uniref:Small multi-drug export protein n=1 Tax=Aegilops tauschii subsp. strangulata TaxID=200361 RepID=A0A453M446_AEGTS